MSHRTTNHRGRGAGRGPRRRRGAIIVLSAFLLIVLLVMLAFSIDVGYMYTMQTQCQRQVDAATLAGAGALPEGEDAARAAVVEYLVRNPVGNRESPAEGELSIKIEEFMQEHGDEIEVKLGTWDSDTRTFEESSNLPSAISVRMRYPNNPLFFGQFAGRDNFTVQADSIATFQPRDIMLVLDLSGSMNDDSEFGHRNKPGLSLESIKQNLEECWYDLGAPAYGSLAVEPQYLTVWGQPPTAGNQPQITVEYRHKSVYVTSTKDLSNVVLRYSNGNEQKFEGLSGKTAVFAGTGGNSNKPIYKVWVKSGANASGEGPGYGEPFDFHPDIINSKIKAAFNLNSTPYPGESGSWDSYINYCKSSNQTNADVGYRYKFGVINLMNYWLEKKESASQTSFLYQVSAQPITAVKNAVDVFTVFIEEGGDKDRIGFSAYNSANSGYAKLESGLTHDFALIKDLVRARQAGHYHSYTNIGAGMQVAREEIEANARSGAFKMMVVLTDGKANWVNGGYDQEGARAYVLSEAQKAADAKIPIVAISLGADADSALMQQIADITKGEHFNIPGGQTVEEYEDNLRAVFKKIADKRPLQIVH